jgi:ribosomal protein S12 methylthiotransferase
MVEIPGLVWIRLLYAYPNFLERPLLDLIRESESICKYIDIPFQHISPRLLQRMRRGKSGSAVRETVHKLREAIPDVTLRTSLIVRFPGETEEDFEELLDFVEEARFERLGVFKYSEEEGTTAAQMGGKVSEEEKERRWQELMDLQATISQKNQRALIGAIQRVMIENTDFDLQLVGRTQAHAPEVDGNVFVKKSGFADKTNSPAPGDIIDVRIVDALDYDLIGEKIHGC